MENQAAINDFRGTLQAPVERSEFVPPPRFQTKTFDSFIIDHTQVGQAEAVECLKSFALGNRARWWQWHRRNERPGLYLDGDFGVGKTHLLSSAWHAARGTKVYLSFSEAISLTVMLGAQQAVELLASDLVCIDEFELDDPSNTRLADLLIEGLVERGSRIVVTSNTVPGELGQGRMFVDQFRRQLNRVAEAFEDVHVPGADYRQRAAQNTEAHESRWQTSLPTLPESWWTTTATNLDKTLVDIPVVNLRRFAAHLSGIAITNLEPFGDQLAALRFVHLVDRLYDWQVPLAVAASGAIDDIFLPEYRDLGYAKKYRRCRSRLVELCHEEI